MILDKLVAAKREELASRQKTLSELECMIASQPASLDFAAALRGDGVKLIAEVKKASPSRGLLCPDFDPVALAKTYAENGASAISVITEVPHFQGSLDYLSAIKAELTNRRSIPVLRKDFLFDPYHIYEARAYGADALLLIVAILDDTQIKELLDLSHELGMKCLVEVHDEKEVARALKSGAEVIGINNRDLRSFEVDLETTRRLRALIPSDRIVVSESGIRDGGDISKLREWRVNAALIGEALVTARDVAAKVRELA